jgi:hypothetical protein
MGSEPSSSEYDFFLTWRELQTRSDGWNWYWLSYGEKCYAFACVTAFPLNEGASMPPAGTKLELHPTKDNCYVAEDGTEMLVDEQVASVERQNGDIVCQFIAQAYADAQKRFGGLISPSPQRLHG